MIDVSIIDTAKVITNPSLRNFYGNRIPKIALFLI